MMAFHAQAFTVCAAYPTVWVVYSCRVIVPLQDAKIPHLMLLTTEDRI